MLRPQQIRGDDQYRGHNKNRKHEIRDDEKLIVKGNPTSTPRRWCERVNPVTAGIISAKNRKLQVAKRLYEEVFQTDAAINPGNSGGPLINMNGEVVGLNAFIIQSSQCLGFAIGIDTLKDQLDQFFFK